MGFFDSIAGALGAGKDLAYGHPISNAVGKLVDATTSNGASSGLTKTPAARAAFVAKLSKTPEGKKRLAYYLKNLGYNMATAGPEGFKWAAHGFTTLGEEPDQVDRYNRAWDTAKHPKTTTAPPASNTPDGKPVVGSGGTKPDPYGDPLAEISGTGGSTTTMGADYGPLLNGLNPKTAALLNPQQYAKNQAGLQFNAKLSELMAGQARLKPQAAQNEANIKSWYDQVGKQQELGLTATKASNVEAQSGIADLGKNLISAAGGNETAAGLVASGATTGAGTLGAIGASNEALASRLKELTSLEGKTRGIDEQRYQTKLANDMLREIADTKSQKGMATADALSKALTFNNEARQTNFANRLSTIQTQIGADAAGLDVAGKQIDLESKKIGLAGDILTYRDAQQKLKSGGRVFWNKMAPEARAGLVNAAVNAVLGKKGNPISDKKTAQKRAYNWGVQTAGINNPAFRASIDRELVRRFPRQFG